jgi:putative methionine-R-sulfoxide reductase with GAF domain
MAQIARADGAALRIPDKSAGGFIWVASTSALDATPSAELIPWGQGLVSRAFESKTVVATDDYANHQDSIHHLSWTGTTSEVAVPVLFDDRAIGVITLISRTGWEFDDRFVSLLNTVARQIAES